MIAITDGNKSYYVYIKDFNRFMCKTKKCKSKKHFCKYCLQCFISKNYLLEHKEVCLKINGKQTVKLTELRVVTQVIILNILKKIKTIFFGVLSIKFFVLMINLIKQMLFTEEKMRFIDLLKQFLQSMFIGGE